MEKLYLSRRNLLSLLSKLDRNKLDRNMDGETSYCTIIKSDNSHPLYPQSMPLIAITAYEKICNEGNSKRQLYISRADINALLNFLNDNEDRNLVNGDVRIIPIENDKYYIDRSPGEMHPLDEPKA